MCDEGKEIEKSVVDEITKLHTKIFNRAKTNLKEGVRIGELLSKVKADLKHGEWLLWITKNVQFSDRTANRYMLLYKHRDKLKSAIVSDLTTAYKLLAAPEDYYEEEEEEPEKGSAKSKKKEKRRPEYIDYSYMLELIFKKFSGMVGSIMTLVDSRKEGGMTTSEYQEFKH